jgi:hypothetical protein
MGYQVYLGNQTIENIILSNNGGFSSQSRAINQKICLPVLAFEPGQALTRKAEMCVATLGAWQELK